MLLAGTVVALAAIMVAGAPVPSRGTSSVEDGAAGALVGGATGAAPTSAAAWTPAALASAPLRNAPDDEPGLGLAGSTLLGNETATFASDPTGTLPVLIGLGFSNESRLAPFLASLSDPSSDRFHAYLTASEFDATFGAPAPVYSALVAYLESFGVTALATHPDRLAVSFAATPAQLDQIFHTQIGSYVSSTGLRYYAPESAPSLPAPLDPYLLDVEGLSNYSGYLTAFAPLAMATPTVALEGDSAPAGPVPSSGGLAPGGTGNPFGSTTVTSNNLTNTYDQPVEFNLSGRTGVTCATTTCGELVQAPDLQVTYNETGLFRAFGYPTNASVAAILWSDPICTSDTGTCASDGLFNYYCSTLPTNASAWDFYLPDVTSFWNYTIPAGEPMPTAYSLGETGYTYAYPAGSQGYSAACDSGGAEGENTLDVDMLGALAPGANVFQVFGGAGTFAALLTAFSDILSPSTSEFSSDGGFDTSASMAKLGNVSVITNSWTSSGALGSMWYADLEAAQARGISVLAATGDAGTALAPPAEIGNNTYGAVAVGGTTAVLNRTSLLRGPPHAAVSSAPYYGVGTGEVGWYEPAGTVYGFSSTLGGTGGVATSTSYYRATWFNASADAVSVANLVRTGDYRAEPDVAAIANDTILDLDEGPYSLNFTCWVTSCRAISSLAVGTTSGSAPIVGGTYFVGTSIATPVTGGLVATIDHALHQEHQGGLGYLDPTVYPLGQQQFAGELSMPAFYDVSVYTGAGGLTSAYEARAGYDLATGWGVLDAGNLTQDTMTFNATFGETGLPGGTRWTVTVTPTVGDANCTVSGSACSNSAVRNTTGSTLVFPELFGNYTYTVASNNASYTAAGGSFRIDGAAVAVPVGFTSSTQPVTFTEVGLPPGTTWAVNLSGGASHRGSAPGSIGFNEPPGTYTYTIFSGNRSWAAPGGSFSVVTSPVTVPVAFHAVTYGITFSEYGLPTGANWSITVNGTAHALVTDGGTDVLSFAAELNGTYAYAIGAVPGWTEGSLPAAGTLVVDGSPVSELLAYAPATYAVSFLESGLPSGTWWAATVNGVTHNSTGTSLSFLEPNGSFPYSVGTVAGYSPSPSSGALNVTASSVPITILYAVSAPPALSAAPAQGPSGATVDVSGGGFTGDHLVALVLGSEAVGSSSCFAGSLLTDAAGAFGCELHVPLGASGTTMDATDINGAVAAAAFWVTTPTVAISPAQGPIGATVTVTVHGYSVYTAIGSLVIGGIAVTSCTSGSLTTGTIAPGGFACSFVVPTLAPGVTVSVVATDVGGAHASTTFWVTAPTLSIAPGQGPVGAAVLVEGRGFSVSTPIASFEFGGIPIATCSSGSLMTGAVAAGGFNCGIVVPGLTPGATVTVSATDVGGASASTGFWVTLPTLSVAPGQGPVGATITVTGHGFSVDTPIASLVFDGVPITSCVAGSLTTGTIAAGGFSCTFRVPSGPSGSTVLVQATDAGGAHAGISFRVTTPTLSVIPGQGPVGAAVMVEGRGFSVSTRISSLVFGGVSITMCSSGSLTSGTVALGGFNCGVTVPALTSGSTVLVEATDVSGSSAATGFWVTTPTISISPTAGPPGTPVTVTGRGFSVDTPITSLTFAGLGVASCSTGSLTTGGVAAGGFECTFTVPVNAQVGNATVIALDAGGSFATTLFTVTGDVFESPAHGGLGHAARALTRLPTGASEMRGGPRVRRVSGRVPGQSMPSI